MKQLGLACFQLVDHLEDVEDTEVEHEDSVLHLEDPLVLELHFGGEAEGGDSL